MQAGNILFALLRGSVEAQEIARKQSATAYVTIGSLLCDEETERLTFTPAGNWALWLIVMKTTS